jgi:hypothetical protein
MSLQGFEVDFGRSFSCMSCVQAVGDVGRRSIKVSPMKRHLMQSFAHHFNSHECGLLSEVALQRRALAQETRVSL